VRDFGNQEHGVSVSIVDPKTDPKAFAGVEWFGGRSVDALSGTCENSIQQHLDDGSRETA